jgi:hypothetical protein
VLAPPSLGHGEFYEFVFVHGLFVHQKCSNYALTNLLFNLCRSVWMIDLLVIRPSPPCRNFNTPLYPRSVANLRMYPNFLSFQCFHLWIRSWIYQGAWGVSHGIHNLLPLKKKCQFVISICDYKTITTNINKLP